MISLLSPTQVVSLSIVDGSGASDDSCLVLGFSQKVKDLGAELEVRFLNDRGETLRVGEEAQEVPRPHKTEKNIASAWNISTKGLPKTEISLSI